MPIRLLAAAPLVLAVTLGTWGVAAMVESDPPDQREVHARIDGPVLTSDAHWNGGMTALIEGPIRLVDDCLRIGRASPVVIWPTGTEWDEKAGAVRLSDGTIAEVGDRVSGGGGALSDENVADVFNDELAKAASACDRDGQGGAVVFNPDAVLDVEASGQPTWRFTSARSHHHQPSR
jgi:hypothetical protein